MKSHRGRDTRWLSAFGALLAGVGCSSGDDSNAVAPDGGGATGSGGAAGSGGTGAATGGTSSTGGTTAATGGTTAATGGTSSTGGTTAATGGTSSTGGTTAATGGASSTGGTTAATGGTSSTGGASSTGGTTAATGGTSGTGGTTGGTSNGQWVIGYHPGYQLDQYPLAAIDWSAMTHIVFGSVGVKGDHTLDQTFFQSNETNGKARATEIADAAHAHGVKAILMLGGAGFDNIAGAIATDVNLFASRLVAAATALHYDGIDLDVEDGSTMAALTQLAQALRTAAPDLIITAPIAGSIGFGSTVAPELVTLAQYVDRIAIQSYYGGSYGLFTGREYTGTRYFKSWFPSALSGATELTPFAIDFSLDALAKAGIPKGKLQMGIATYATCYDIPATTPPGGQAVSAPLMDAYAPSAYCWDCGTSGGDNQFPLSAFFATNGRLSQTSAGEQKRDATAKEPYLSLASAVNESHCAGDTRYILYEDEQSIIDKGTFSKQNGYGGIIVWTLAQAYLPNGGTGGRGPNAITQALKQGFLGP